jgi:hypothetical protein
VAQGDGQGIGGVDLRFLGQLQQVHDHHHHLLLVGPTGAGHGLLDLVAVYSAISRPASAAATMQRHAPGRA